MGLTPPTPAMGRSAKQEKGQKSGPQKSRFQVGKTCCLSGSAAELAGGDRPGQCQSMCWVAGRGAAVLPCYLGFVLVFCPFEMACGQAV